MAASLQAATTLMQPAKIGVQGRSTNQLRSALNVSKPFGVEPGTSRLTCSLQADLKDLAQKCSDAYKVVRKKEKKRKDSPHRFHLNRHNILSSLAVQGFLSKNKRGDGSEYE